SIRLRPFDRGNVHREGNSSEDIEWGGAWREEGDGGDGAAASEIVFTWNQQDRTLPIDQVRLLRLVATAAAPAASAGRVFCADGSTIRFDVLSTAGGMLTLTSPELGEMSLVRTHVLRVEFHSDRVVYLSDLEPTEVVEHGLMDRTFNYRANQAVSGRPIVLDGQTYDRGLGLHSVCELTYSLDGEFTMFAATVGIDDAARPNGDATLVVLADGQPLGEPLRLTGQGGAQLLRLDVADVDTLTVRVDFGDDQLDVGDHVDLAEARLIR
ncbi:MAG: NPCBM/NEW2 domain-containing protein, partial [Planctomycetota bacterium]